jgi:hypothetical protein
VSVETQDRLKAQSSPQKMGRIGAELVVKAAICAAMIAMLAGIAAAFLGS